MGKVDGIGQHTWDTNHIGGSNLGELPDEVLKLGISGGFRIIGSGLGVGHFDNGY